MTPLRRYYGSFLIALILGIAAGSVQPSAAQNALVVAILALVGYAMFVRCPQCGTPLRKQRDGLTHGLPGRKCQTCGCDLSR